METVKKTNWGLAGTQIDDNFTANKALIDQVQTDLDTAEAAIVVNEADIVAMQGQIGIYGAAYDTVGKTWTRLGRLNGISAEYSNKPFSNVPDSLLPIQRNMKRCVLNDDLSVNYYLNGTDSYNKAGVEPFIFGTDGAGTANKVSEVGLFALAEAQYVGKYIHNTTDDSYAMITAKDSDNVLTIDADIMASGDTFEICTAVLNGDDGQVMVEIPEHWWKYELVGDVQYWWLSPTMQSVGDGWTKFKKSYIGAYEAQMYDLSADSIVGGQGGADVANDKLCSVNGIEAHTDETRAEYRALAANRGTGWHQQDNRVYAAVVRLYLVEYANYNSQAKISDGLTNASGTDWNDYNGYCPLVNSGLTNSLGNATGEVAVAIPNFVGGTTDLNTQVMSYRGIENWYGHIWKWMDGVNIFHDGTGAGESMIYLCEEIANYADDVVTNYELAGYLPKTSGYYGYPLAIASGFFPDSSETGSSSVGLADYYYSGYDAEAATWRVAALGGYAYHGVKAGAFCVGSKHSSTDDYSNIGGRLCAAGV